MPTQPNPVRLADDLKHQIQGPVRLHEPLARLTTFKIGGPADLLISPVGVEELRIVLELTRAAGLPVTVLGRGSNLLIDDSGIRGVVVQIGKGLDALVVTNRRISAGAGVPLGLLARTALRYGLRGMEWGVLVPGNLGGGIYMNAGAKGQETQDVVRRVLAFDRTGRSLTFSREECAFSYRMSRFQHEDLIVIEAELELTPDDPKQIEARMAEIQVHRKRTMPVSASTGGATFKRPPGHFVGQLIESAGCKGWREGGVYVSPVHANYFINGQNGTAADVRALIQRVHQRVKEVHGIELEREVIFAGGESGWDLPYAGRP